MSAMMDIEVTSGDGSVERFEEKPKVVSPPAKADKETPKADAEPIETPEPVAAKDPDEDDDDDDGVSDTVPRSRYKAKLAKKDLAINERHRKWKEQEEISRELFGERNAAQARIVELEKELESQKSQAAKAPEKTREDFKTDEEWIDYRAELKVAAAEQRRVTEQLQQAEDERKAQLSANREKFKKTVNDWDDAMATVADMATNEKLDIPPLAEDFFYEAENGNAVLYKLAKDPKRFREILKLKPATAVKALWEVHAELTAKPAEPEPKSDDKLAARQISKAPPPIAPHAEGAAPNSKRPVDMNTQEYDAYYEQKMRERRRKGLN